MTTSHPDWTLAIDFGTSNTAAAHTNPLSGEVETLPLSHTGSTMPSAVFIASPDEIEVGDVARDRAEAYPPGYLPSPKRSVPQGVVQVAGYEVPVARPVAAVLRAVLQRACAAHSGTAPSRLVLTHPEAWLPREVQGLTDAAASLGLPPATVVSTVSEPRAAARFYSGVHHLPAGRLIAVFDFGGGTLDVAVLRSDGTGGFDVVAARGDNALGGRSVDSAIRAWVDRQLDDSDPDRLEWLRTRAPMDAHLGLDASIRRAKELLSEASSATITVPGEDGRTHLQLTRGEFEELVSDQLDAAVDLTRAALTDAGVTGPEGVEALYLTGGSSRIPAVHERLGRLGRVATLDDPKTVVARGAISAVTADPFAGLAAPASTRPMPASEAVADDAPGHLGADATPATHRRSRVPLVAAAVAAAIVLLAAGLGAWALLGDRGGDGAAEGSHAASSGSADPSGAAAPSTGAVAIAKTKEAVLAGLPPQFAEALTDCKHHGETDDGGAEIQCRVSGSSPAFAGAVPERGYTTAFVSVDRGAARADLYGIRRHTHDDSTRPVNELVEDAERTSAGTITGPNTSGEFDVFYANSTTGVKAWIYGLASLEGAKASLTRSGLMSG